MQAPSILKISEIFWSFQGEGARAGNPAIFLRLAGCSLQCSNCDTMYSWEKGTPMEIDFIMSQVDRHKRNYPSSQVVITGGEPLEQDLSAVTAALNKGKYFTAVETNGIHSQEIAVDWWSVSPKIATDFYINEKLYDKIDEVKLIVTQDLSPGIIKRIRQISDDFPIFLQPDWYDKDKYKNTFSLYRQCQAEGITNIRPGIQLHKIYNIS